MDIPEHAKDCGVDFSKSTMELRKEIAVAVSNQRERQKKKNAALSPSEAGEFCVCSPAARKKLSDASERFNFSPRAISSCLKTARTIADMDDSTRIEETHMEEAVMYRSTEGGLGSMI